MSWGDFPSENTAWSVIEAGGKPSTNPHQDKHESGRIVVQGHELLQGNSPISPVLRFL